MFHSSSLKRHALVSATLSYVAWGVLPLFWKLLATVPPFEVLCHRILWSAVYLGILVAIQGRWGVIKNTLRAPRLLLTTITSAILVAANWLLFIWSVSNNRIVEGSLGYFICPLVVVGLGWIVRGERLRPLQCVAVAFAAIGVGYSLYGFGYLPIVSLGLALTFALYGFLKKGSALGPTDGLFVETAMLAPAALVALSLLASSGVGVIVSGGTELLVWCVLAGVATSLPLQWFAHGAQNLKMITMGILQYLAPTLQLAIGAFVYSEDVSVGKLVTFGFIWIGLVIYTLDALLMVSKRRSQGSESKIDLAH